MIKVRTTVTNVEKHLRTPSEHAGRDHEGFEGIINSQSKFMLYKNRLFGIYKFI